MLRLAAGSCSSEIRPLLLAFQLHFTALHICCESYFSAFSPSGKYCLTLTPLAFFDCTASSLILYPQKKFSLSLSLYSLFPQFVIYLFSLFNLVGRGGGAGQVTRSKETAKKQGAQ